MYREWIKQGLRKPGKSQAGLARHLNVSEPKVSRMVNGATRLRVDELSKISEYISEPLPQLTVDAMVTRTVQIIGQVRAGYWRDRGQGATMEQATQRVLAVPDEPQTRGLDLYALELAQEGGARAHVVCVRVSSAGRAPRAGDRVHYIAHHPATADLVQDMLGELEPAANGAPILKGASKPTPASLLDVQGIVIQDVRSYSL